MRIPKFKTSEATENIQKILQGKFRSIFYEYLNDQRLSEQDIRYKIDSIFRDYLEEDEFPNYYLDLTVDSISIYPMDAFTQNLFKYLKL